MGNMNELDNVKDVSDFLNSHGITGKNILSQGCKNEKDLIAMKLLDLERKGYVKFEKGLGYEIIDRNYTGLLESDQMILCAINDGIVKLDEEGKIKTKILNELYRDMLIKNVRDNVKIDADKLGIDFGMILFGCGYFYTMVLLLFSGLYNLILVPFISYIFYVLLKPHMKFEGIKSVYEVITSRGKYFNLTEMGENLINKIDALDDYNRLKVNTKHLDRYKKYIKYNNNNNKDNK